MPEEVSTVPVVADSVPKKNKGGRPRKRPIESVAVAVPSEVPPTPKLEASPEAIEGVLPGSVGAVQEARNSSTAPKTLRPFWWLRR